MSDPWDGMSKEPLSKEELRKLRYQMQFFEQNDSVFRRAVQVFRAWWLLPAGVILAVSGSIGGVVDFIAKSAGVGQ